MHALCSFALGVGYTVLSSGMHLTMPWELHLTHARVASWWMKTTKIAEFVCRSRWDIVGTHNFTCCVYSSSGAAALVGY